MNTYRQASRLVQQRRAFSVTCGLRATGSSDSLVLSSRWLTDLRKRLKACQSKSLSTEKAKQVESYLAQLNDNWLDLSAGREGYLTETKWKGLDKLGVLWGDMDSMVSHVNNIRYNRWAESGRVNWVGNLANDDAPERRDDWLNLMTPKGLGMILGSIKTDFKFPMKYPDQVTVMHRLVSKPEALMGNFILEAAAYSEKHQRLAARFIEDIAVYDYQAGKKTVLKPFMVEKLQQLFEKQNQAKAAADQKIVELHRFVDDLESQS